MNAHARHVTGAKAISVQTLARQMLTEAGDDLNKATDKFVGYLANFPRLAEEVLRIGARKLINEVPQAERKAITMRESTATPFAKAPHRMNDGARRAQERILKRGVDVTVTGRYDKRNERMKYKAEVALSHSYDLESTWPMVQFSVYGRETDELANDIKSRLHLVEPVIAAVEKHRAHRDAVRKADRLGRELHDAGRTGAAIATAATDPRIIARTFGASLREYETRMG
ncbi:hypothetical protein [Mesorhizobium sp.]|uniref:hypothetical protein n=1 Tax=Mesorhizobium sp. TaxID=1871066 RepID=UPI00120CA12E|nr:hypothetical protein [Mesorhizobium sp.]TIL38570.1 MAG: hypothetical protein E5Y82_13830 [Mesorhizobium sp.]